MPFNPEMRDQNTSDDVAGKECLLDPTWGQDTVPTPRFLPLDIILKDPNYKPV